MQLIKFPGVRLRPVSFHSSPPSVVTHTATGPFAVGDEDTAARNRLSSGAIATSQMFSAVPHCRSMAFIKLELPPQDLPPSPEEKNCIAGTVFRVIIASRGLPLGLTT